MGRRDPISGHPQRRSYREGREERKGRFRAFFAVSPFDNYPAFLTLTGREVEQLLRATSRGARGIMQVSGVRYTFDASKKGLERFRNAVLDNGTPIDPEKLYTVIMPDFIAAGGDGAAEVMKGIPPDRIQTSFAAPIRDVLIEQLAAQSGPLEPRVEGRITVLNRPAP